MGKDKGNTNETIEELEEFDGCNMSANEILAYLIRNQGSLEVIKKDDPNWLEKTMKGVTIIEH